MLFTVSVHLSKKCSYKTTAVIYNILGTTLWIPTYLEQLQGIHRSLLKKSFLSTNQGYYKYDKSSLFTRLLGISLFSRFLTVFSKSKTFFTQKDRLGNQNSKHQWNQKKKLILRTFIIFHLLFDTYSTLSIF